MRISETTINEVKDRISIAEVVSAFIQVKKNTASCPFHNEKTASLHIHPAKNIFKCFGCGKGGDAITFVMEHEKKTYPEAIEYLAGMYHVAIERDDSYDPVKEQEAKDALTELRQVVKFALDKYTSHPGIVEGPAAEYLKQRGMPEVKVKEWGLGYAPDEWKFITPSLVNMGKLTAAVQAGISVSKEGKNWDFYRNRIIIPIHNALGELVGIAGRDVPCHHGPVEGRGEAAPKYINPFESLLYQKQKIWYGLYQAITAKAFKENDFAYVVEGYFDVIAMHEAGCYNTVAACGTEVSDEQIKQLMKYVKHIVLLLDGDEPGIKKAMKHIDNFLRLGYKVEVVELPDGMDPDEYVRKFKK